MKEGQTKPLPEKPGGVVFNFLSHELGRFFLFFVHDVTTHVRIVFLDFHTLRVLALVFLGVVFVAAFRAFKLNMYAAVAFLGHDKSSPNG